MDVLGQKTIIKCILCNGLAGNQADSKKRLQLVQFFSIDLVIYGIFVRKRGTTCNSYLEKVVFC